MENIVVHVGFSRTGTTTFQKHLFCNHSQIQYLGKPHDGFLQNEILKMVKQETMIYNPSALRDYIRISVSGKIDGSKKVVLLSNEILVSRGKSRDKGIVAKRIKEVFYPCRIFFTIRNQFEILKSAYLCSDRFLVNAPGRYCTLAVNFPEWLEMSYKMHENMDCNYISHVDYYKTIDYYAKLFGKNNVGVFVFDEFIHNQDEYIKKLSEFLNIDLAESLLLINGKHEHKEISQFQWKFEQLRSKLFPLSRIPGISHLFNMYYRLNQIFRKEKAAYFRIPGEWMNRLTEIYREGNRKLVEEYHLPLESYGYPL